MYGAPLVAQLVKNLPARAGDTRDKSSVSGLESSCGEGNGSLLRYSAWEIPWTEEPDGLQSMGLQGVGHDRVCTHTHTKGLANFWNSLSTSPVIEVCMCWICIVKDECNRTPGYLIKA